MGWGEGIGLADTRSRANTKHRLSSRTFLPHVCDTLVLCSRVMLLYQTHSAWHPQDAFLQL